MFDIGWDEMALIGVISLIVIGPKDLPIVLRQLGRWTRKARDMASEFQRGIDDMARETELQDLRKEVAKVSDVNLLRQEVDKAIDPDGDMAKALELPALDASPTHSETAPTELAPDQPQPRPPEP